MDTYGLHCCPERLFFKGGGARHYVSPTNGGGERLKDVNCVAVKFIWFPAKDLLCPHDPINYSPPLYTLLATTDSTSAPPENRMIPKILYFAIPGSRLTGLAIVTVMTKLIFVVSNNSAEISAKSSQPGSCNQAPSQCIFSNYKNCRLIAVC